MKFDTDLVEVGDRKGAALTVVVLQRQVEVVGLQRIQFRVTPATLGNATQVPSPWSDFRPWS